jgi:alpha-glucosidase (family GH31 glycosyl hydrolase)
VAPVVERGVENREVYLPPEQWIDYYDHQVWPGDQTIDYQAPVDRLPLLVRAGSIIPMRPYAGSIEAGSNDTLLLHIFPGDREEGRFVLWEDDGVSEGYLTGEVAETNFAFRQRGNRLDINIGAVNGRYSGIKRDRNYEVHILLDRQPDSVELDGRELPPTGYRYDPGRQWLSIELGRLTKDENHQLVIR